jgi:predicted esterase
MTVTPSAQTPQIHEAQPVFQAGASLKQAAGAMLMIHGRGAGAQDILSLSSELAHPEFAYLAPQAAGYTWYPNRFMEPLASNEPYLSSALATVGAILESLDQAGLPREKVILLGFSQGACLSLEYVARNARRYGGVVALSGGLIGPDGTPRDYPGSLDSTPIFLGCSDVDPHIPKARVVESAEIMGKIGGNVNTRIYPNMGHTINDDEIKVVREMIAALVEEKTS